MKDIADGNDKAAVGRWVDLASYLGIGLAAWSNPRNPLIRVIRDSDKWLGKIKSLC